MKLKTAVEASINRGNGKQKQTLRGRSGVFVPRSCFASEERAGCVGVVDVDCVALSTPMYMELDAPIVAFAVFVVVAVADSEGEGACVIKLPSAPAKTAWK